MNLYGKTIAVTGAGGFIGSALVPALIATGAKIQALTAPPNVRLPRVLDPTIEMRGEITEIETALRLCKNAEIVVHLAGPSSVSESFEQPVDYARTHVLGTVTILQACRALSVPRLVYLSSGEVYGQPLTCPVNEDHPLAARSPYGACKVAAEEFIRAHVMAHDLKVVILRPFSIYGSGMSDLSLIKTLFRQAQEAESLSMHDLRPIRDYCYLDDLVWAIQLACTRTHGGMLTLNIGSGKGISVRELATTLITVLGRDLPIRECKSKRRPGRSEILELVADIRHAQKALGWAPTVGLSEGLRRIAMMETPVISGKSSSTNLFSAKNEML